MGDDELPPLHRPARAVDPEVKLRENIIERGKKLNDSIEKRASALLAVEAAERALAEQERDVAARRSNWDDAIRAYQEHISGS